MCAKVYFKRNGREDIVLDELCKLPDQFILLKNVFLRLHWPVTHQKTSEIVRSCQIDYVVIGPPGVSIIEAKTWDKNSFTDMIPYQEADKAGLVVYIKLKRYFNKKLPIYNIIVTFGKVPYTQYGYIHQLSIWNLTTFIFDQEEILSKSEIRELGKIFMRKFR
jgi:hypothetical protein